MRRMRSIVERGKGKRNAQWMEWMRIVHEIENTKKKVVDIVFGQKLYRFRDDTACTEKWHQNKFRMKL